MDYVRLKKRAEFIKVAEEKKAFKKRAFIFQYSLRENSDQLRFGITASRKIGGAVERNRAKRRLREIIRIELKDLPQWDKKNYDCVLIALHHILTIDFLDLRQEFKNCLEKLASLSEND